MERTKHTLGFMKSVKEIKVPLCVARAGPVDNTAQMLDMEIMGLKLQVGGRPGT